MNGDVGAIWFLDNDVGGIGAIASVAYSFLPSWAARAGGSVRFGSINNSNDLPLHVWSLFGGLAYQPLRPRLRERFGVSIRASWVVDLEEISSTLIPGSTQSPPLKVNYGPEAAADAEFLIVPDVEVILGGGAEYMLRPSTITIPASQGGSRVILWRQARPFGEGGFRIRF